MFAKTLALVLAVAQVVLADCTRTYTVQNGDICDSISASQGVSTYQLAVVNEGIINEECDNLTPGSSICLGWPGEDCTSTYVVQAGDTCDYVSAMKNINGTIFSLNNPQFDEDCTNMYIGEVVCVAASVVVPPTPTSPIYGSTIPATATPADIVWCD